MKPYENGPTHEFARIARQFLLKWSFYRWVASPNKTHSTWVMELGNYLSFLFDWTNCLINWTDGLMNEWMNEWMNWFVTVPWSFVIWLWGVLLHSDRSIWYDCCTTSTCSTWSSIASPWPPERRPSLLWASFWTCLNVPRKRTTCRSRHQDPDRFTWASPLRWPDPNRIIFPSSS